MLIIGLISALFGFQLMRFIFFMTGISTIIAGLFFFLYEVVLPKSTPGYTGWILLFGILTLGILFGMLMIKYGRVAMLLLGSWLGAVFGLTFYIGFLHELSNPGLMIAMTVLPVALICAIVSAFFW